MSLGASALLAIISLIGSLTARKALGHQQALLVGSMAPGRPWLDLSLQLANILVTLAPVALVFYLLARSGESPSDMGLDTTRPASDLARGAALAAIIGGLGLGLYITAFHLGVSLNVVPESLPAVWWRIPVLVLSAAHNGILEEIVVLGYLLTRLDQLGWSPAAAVIASAVLRGSYHLYQGFGGFLGNLAMGIIFGVLFLPSALIDLLPRSWHDTAMKFAPANAGTQILNVHREHGMLGPWQGLAVLVLYATIIVLGALYLVGRRDA